ncbi:hypothetical protein HDU96_008748 [Phlyctochytrium bullatum]|nr:hypothetical protein HDU96_008748 [Phlyctochytrium bullatum]
MAGDPAQEAEASQALTSIASSLGPSTLVHVVSLKNGALLASSGSPPADLARQLFGLVYDSNRVVTQSGEKFKRIVVSMPHKELVVTADDKFIYAVEREPMVQ